MRYFVFIFLFLLLHNSVSASLSEKISVKISIPYNTKIVKKTIYEQKSGLLAKSLIIKKYIRNKTNFPASINEYHKDYIFGLLYKSKRHKFELIDFKQDSSYKKNNKIFYVFSSKIKLNNDVQNIDIWNFLNQLLKKNEFDVLLSLELALSYKNNLELISVLKKWKKQFKGAILYIVTNNLIPNYQLFEFLDKDFKSKELNTNLREVTYLFDLAPFNLDICLKMVDVLNNKNYRTLSNRILSSCKTIHSKKISQSDIKILKNEILLLENLNIKLDPNDLLLKSVKYQGFLPIKLPKIKIPKEISQLDDLFLNFKNNPSINNLIKIRDKLKSKKFYLIPKLLTNQIGVSQNAIYKY